MASTVDDGGSRRWSMAGFTSILFPGAHPGPDVTGPTPPECLPDLCLDQIIDEVTAAHGGDGLAQFFYLPLHDVSAVEYRHEVFRDLERDQRRQPVENFIDRMRTVRLRLHHAERVFHPLQKQGWFLHAVDGYCGAVKTLRDDLGRVAPTSRGLRDFADYVAGYVDSEEFQKLSADTQAVTAELRKVRYTVHIQGLRVHVQKFDGQPDYSSAITATFERFATEASKDYHIPLKDFADMDHVEEQILECVAKLHPQPFALLERFCSRHHGFIDHAIGRFEREAHFYLSYLAFIGRFAAAGLAFSYPEVTSEPGVLRATDAFDLALAIKTTGDGTPVVRNDFRLSGPERIFVITGPNQGGKTTLARTIGQCAYLGALGCPVPASRAELSLPDQIYTHFERRESLSRPHGKLDDELVRIHDILARATEASIIMNESFSSTTAEDALLINTEVLKRIIRLGCVAVCVTFLDELAALGPACVSMVGEVAPDDPTRRTFTFTRRPADGLAYAAALANKYRLNYDTLRQRITR
ncbi:MAG: DNA mismatch repair protein MutS [Mycobacterium sp.]|uniref:MutS-related protein n=1 Tax=Mycobacterium sp. TaxID=1785 RepID=UPI0026217726|nr:DNA mismatch repair protein MutS [Mycobacterium sp.]MDI3314316.1 DNA mismatch repair protein MutS [Mycobacterium sp.]